jgi:phosphatidylglycerol:prolipoprotein diacylglycerol transferase
MMPTMGQIGPITIRTYSLLLDVAVLIGLAALAWRAWQLDQKPAYWLDAGLGALVVGLVAARVGHVAIHWAYFSEHPGEIWEIWRGGLDWHSAILGGLGGLAGVCRLRKLGFWQVSDALAWGLPIGVILTYSGCLMTSCGHGREVRSLADYPTPLVAELPDLYGITAPRFSSQLYGIALGVALLSVVALLRRWPARLWAALALLGLGAFGIGFTRGDAVPMVGSLRLDQIFDLVIAVTSIAVAVWVHRANRGEKRTTSDIDEELAFFP